MASLDIQAASVEHLIFPQSTPAMVDRLCATGTDGNTRVVMRLDQISFARRFYAATHLPQE